MVFQVRIKWDHNQETKKHTFTIDSISRIKEDQILIISYNGKSKDIDVVGEEEIEIPSISNFKLMKMIVIQQPEQHILIHFSDPLKENQDFRGLVSIKGSKNPRFTVDVNRLKVYPRSRLSGSKKVTVERGILSISEFYFFVFYPQGVSDNQ